MGILKLNLNFILIGDGANGALRVTLILLRIHLLVINLPTQLRLRVPTKVMFASKSDMRPTAILRWKGLGIWD